jgi:hypothetical protein
MLSHIVVQWFSLLRLIREFFKHGARNRHLQLKKGFPVFYGPSSPDGGIFDGRKMRRIFFFANLTLSGL